MRRPSISTYWKKGIALASGFLLVACHGMPSSAPIIGQPSVVSPGGGAPESPSVQNYETSVVGRVDFPELAKGYGVLATSDYLTKGATLTLVSLADNMTVVTGKTEVDGTFSLPLNGFTPALNSMYLLEASRGLNNHAAGSSIARFRTYLRWAGSGWTSTSGTNIVINAQTTAVAIISSLDATKVPPSGTIGKISGTNVNASPALTGHPDSEVTTLATSITSYLTNDFDPVESMTGLKPSITALQPANPIVNGALVLSGTGFSPIPTGNTVRFGTATASVFAASPTTLGVYVPATAPYTGKVTVQTAAGVNPVDVDYTLSVSSGGEEGGSGEGSAGGFAITSMDPAKGGHGDFIVIRGYGFSSTPANNTVIFSQGATASVRYADPSTLTVDVPTGAVAGPVRVIVSGASRSYFFNVNLPTITSFTPTFGSSATDVTITGYNFGSPSTSSRVRFNGFPVSSFVSWTPSKIVVKAPTSQAAAKITGPISIINDENRLGPNSTGTFTARTSYDERFTAAGMKDATTTATWATAGSLTPGAVTNRLNHSGTQLSGTGYEGNNNVDVTATGARLPQPVLRHTGVLPPSHVYSTSLGVDANSYYIGGPSTPNHKYNLKTGASEGQSTWYSIYDNRVWSPTTGLYYFHNYNNISYIWRTSGWNSNSNLGQMSYASSVNMLAVNGTHLMAHSGSTYIEVYTLSNHAASTYWNASTSKWFNGTSMAGITGYPKFLFNQNTTTLSSLLWTTAANQNGSINLPIPISNMSNGTVARIGSDGTNLYILGRNANYNGNADSLFKFNVNQSTDTITLANGTGSALGTVVSPEIDLPDNHIWHQVSYNRQPNGGTCTIEVVDADPTSPTFMSPLASNIANNYDLNNITAKKIRLRAYLNGPMDNSPVLTSWTVSTRGSYALSNAHNTGYASPTYEAQTVTGTAGTYTIAYQTSTNGTSWGSWNADPTKLTGQYIRFRVIFSKSGGSVTRVNLPYTY